MSNGSLHDNKPSGKSRWGPPRNPPGPHTKDGADERTLLVTLTPPSCPSTPSPAEAAPLLPALQQHQLLSSGTLIHPDLHIMVTASTLPLINSPWGHFTLLAAW